MFGAIAHSTLVKTLEGTIPIETISENSAIVTLDPHSHRFATSPAKHITSSTQITAYQITTTADILLCTQDQFFYDPIYEQWVPAKNISSDNHFLTSDLQIIPRQDIEKIKLNEPAIFYEITLEKPHTLFISQAKILTHNAAFLAVPILPTTFATISKICAIIGCITGGILKYNSNNKHKYQNPSIVNTAGSPNIPPEDQESLQVRRKRAKQIAHEMGFKEVKDYKFYSHGEKVFRKGNVEITLDRNTHKGGFWKMFRHKSMERLGTFNYDLSIKIGN